jgi:hypothetical protein
MVNRSISLNSTLDKRECRVHGLDPFGRGPDHVRQSLTQASVKIPHKASSEVSEPLFSDLRLENNYLSC